ncbi:hypothetical protein ACFQO4_06725 [Saliphagus sp. GCM10025334]
MPDDRPERDGEFSTSPLGLVAPIVLAAVTFVGLALLLVPALEPDVIDSSDDVADDSPTPDPFSWTTSPLVDDGTDAGPGSNGSSGDPDEPDDPTGRERGTDDASPSSDDERYGSEAADDERREIDRGERRSAANSDRGERARSDEGRSGGEGRRGTGDTSGNGPPPHAGTPSSGGPPDHAGPGESSSSGDDEGDREQGGRGR